MSKRVLENINDGIITAGADGIVNYINPFASELIGINSDDAMGRHLNEVVKIVDINTGKKLVIPFEQVINNNRKIINLNHSVLMTGKDVKAHVSFDITPFDDEDLKKTGILLVIRDISSAAKSKKETDLKLQKSQEELDQFIYIASHDLQEPLRMVSSYVQLLEKRYKGRLDSDADEFISFAVNGVNKMKNILGDLLSYSRLKTRQGEQAETDCNELLDSLVNSFMSKSGTNIKFEISKLPVIKCDANQIIQLFYHLIDNAVKFSNKNNCLIKISAKRKSNSWQFSVEDNGIGIDEKYSDKIFLMFQKLHNETQYPGTGVGLALCRKIAENHGGEIWQMPNAGEGSTFYFTIADYKEHTN